MDKRKCMVGYNQEEFVVLCGYYVFSRMLMATNSIEVRVETIFISLLCYRRLT